jgi:hypothetical protein
LSVFLRTQLHSCALKEMIALFADPSVITVNAIAKSLNRTSSGNDSSAYSTGDRAYRVQIAHSYGRRTRRLLKMIHDTLTANPLVSGSFVNSTVSVHLVVDSPPGYDTALLKQDIDGYLAWLSASSGANITKLLAGES